ncbi:type IV toxin-antitoxin system AbiEi family antitoxin domain-containing protein [bacterium]|nr:type IV toxin-antitoxin system AbiEi family antitoxin domain-containing protein [bacterium]
MERWNNLYEVASSQSGYFTATQAAECAFSFQLLEHHVRTGRLGRVQRGIYRLTHFPPGEHDDLVVLWLWSEQKGIFSHGTALALHELSDYLPVRYHLTVPFNWKSRRLRVPNLVQLHFADISPNDHTYYGCFSITTVTRTLADCEQDAMSPEWLRQAYQQAEGRGLIPRRNPVLQ